MANIKLNLYKKLLQTTKNIHTYSALNKDSPNNLKNKSPGSQRWLIRQLRDPYVEKARRESYRCRSAFKLLEINNKYNIFSPGLTVVDCGAAPGSWSQVAAKLTNAHKSDEDEPKGSVFAVDRLPIYPIDGVTIIGNSDFTSDNTQNILRQALNGEKVDIVLSDMAPNASGVKDHDHEQIVMLAYSAMKFAIEVSKVNGTFVTKLWDGRLSPEFEKNVARFYKTVKIVRPDATRDESTEKFILARGFKGLKKN